jgi:hypothetical protein
MTFEELLIQVRELLLLGLREPCSRFSCAKPRFAPPWSDAWLPPAKRQHGWRTPRFCPEMQHIYSGQYWACPAVLQGKEVKKQYALSGLRV